MLLVTLVLPVVSCSNRRAVLPLTFDSTGVPEAPVLASDFTSNEATVRGIARILRRGLGLPVPEEVTVYVYGTAKSFERGLVEDAGVSPLRAAELADFAIGVGRPRQLLLYDEGGEHPRREWYRLIAHELTHVAQIELARGEGRAAQWLAEGMAEWAAFTVLERLGLDRLESRRATATIGVRRHPGLAAGRVDLDALGTSRGFTLSHRRDGSLPTYQLAFLMADELVERVGFDGLIEYFRLFAECQTPAANFQRVFDLTPAEFERHVVARFGPPA